MSNWMSFSPRPPDRLLSVLASSLLPSFTKFSLSLFPFSRPFRCHSKPEKNAYMLLLLLLLLLLLH